MQHTLANKHLFLGAIFAASAFAILFFINPNVSIPKESLDFFSFAVPQSLFYSFFLSLFSWADQQIEYVAIAQSIIYVLSIFLFALSLYRTSQKPIIFYAALFILFLNPIYIFEIYKISPNSLYFSCILLFFSFFISAFCNSKFSILSLIGIFCALIYSIHSSGIILLPFVLLILPFIVKNKRCSYLKALLVPLVFIIILFGIERSISHAIYAEQSIATSHDHHFINSLLMESKTPSPYAINDPRTHIWDNYQNMLAFHKEKLWALKTIEARYAELQRLMATLGQIFDQNSLQNAAILLEKTEQDIRDDISTSRIVEDPVAFIKIVLTHYLGTWQNYGIYSQAIMVLSLGCLGLGLFFLFNDRPFNMGFVLAFLTSYILQAQILYKAFCGISLDKPLIALSSLGLLLIFSLSLGFYCSFIHPERTEL